MLRAPIRSRQRAAALNGLEPDYVELIDLEAVTVLAAAVRIGPTRLLDNVVLEGDLR